MTIQCAWCHPQGSPGHDPEASHGICDRHQIEMLVEVPLRVAIARLAGPEYLSTVARAEIVGIIRKAIDRLYVVVTEPAVARPGERTEATDADFFSRRGTPGAGAASHSSPSETDA